jgi:hypothetical protein
MTPALEILKNEQDLRIGHDKGRLVISHPYTLSPAPGFLH